MGLWDRVARRLSSEPAPATADGGSPVPAAADPAGLPDRRQHVIETLRRQVAAGSGGRHPAEHVDPQASLFDRGYLDSFSYVQFLAFIEDTYRVRIDDSQLAGHLTTISAMADHIVREEAARA